LALNSILLLGLFVALLLLFNPAFVSQSYANMGAMGGSSPKHDDDKKGGGDSSSKHDDSKKSGGGDSSPKHKKGGNDNNGGFSSPATTDNTPTQQMCLDGLAPLTASAICGSSQTPTDNIPSSPTDDLVIAGNPPAGVNCVALNECLAPPSTSTTSTPPSTSTTSTPPSTQAAALAARNAALEKENAALKSKYLQAETDSKRLKNAAVAGGLGAVAAGGAQAAGEALAAQAAARAAEAAALKGSIAAYRAAFSAGTYLSAEGAAAAGAGAAAEGAGAAGAAALGTSLIIPVAILGGITAAALCYWYCDFGVTTPEIPEGSTPRG
jgi:hypothetical protein